MRYVLSIVLALPALLSSFADAEDQYMAPFEIPASGKPERLLGDIALEAPTAMAFDSHNRPYLINNRNPESFGTIHTVRNGAWLTRSCLAAIEDAKRPEKRNLHAPGELVIDDDDCLYATMAGHLVYSNDLGETFSAYPCRGTLELRVGPNALAAPPAVCQRTGTTYVDRDVARWAARGTLSVLLPSKTDSGLELGDPIQITDNCMTAGSGGHSGGTSFAVTVDHLTHLVYAETPDNLKDGGNPIYIATVDRTTRTVVARQFLVNAMPKKPDVHTRPTITVDTRGYLHVLSGSHGQPFYYLRSLKANDITGGWTEPVQLIGRQCYASIVCDQDNRLHSVFREWLPHASLGYSSAAVTDADGAWSKPKTLVHGALKRGKYEYGIFYHRMFIDRASTVYVNFTFFEFGTGSDGQYPEALIASDDVGKTCRLAGRQDLVDGILQTVDGK